MKHIFKEVLKAFAVEIIKIFLITVLLASVLYLIFKAFGGIQ